MRFYEVKQLLIALVLTIVTSSVTPFKCGIRKKSINEAIVRGQQTSPGDWPWHAAIYHRGKYISNSYACGGSLISELFVLTAVHCVKGENTYVLAPDRIFVQLGVHNLYKPDRYTQQHDVQRIYQYGNSEKLKNDIALLKLETQAEFNNFVQPVCVNQVEDLTRNIGTAIGWGYDETDKPSAVLKSAKMPVVSGYKCVEHNDGVFALVLDSTLFCAGFANGTSVCNGDSGGGLHFERNGIWYVGGIVSFTAPRDSSNLCHTKSYAAFTNIYHFLSWIASITDLPYLGDKAGGLNHITSSSIPGSIPCTTPTQQGGLCVRLERCKNIYNIVSSPTPMPQYDEYIKRAACTLPGGPRSICCKPTEIGPEPTRAEKPNEYTDVLPKNCGQTLRNRIIGGNDTKVFDYPWMAMIRGGRLPDNIICAGSIIHQRYVLTAARCSRRVTHVLLGEHTKSTEIDCNIYKGSDGKEIERECANPVKQFEIESVIKHPLSSLNIDHNDIALIRLSSEIIWDHHIQPICLPVTPQLRVKQFKKYIFTGWGLTENGEIADILQQAIIPHMNNDDCQRLLSTADANLKLTEKQLCTEWETAGPCRGDAGGPLGMTTYYEGMRFVQFGISTFGPRCIVPKSLPDVYTRVASYMDWILENIKP